MSEFLRASLVHICGTRLPGLQRYYRYSQGTAFLTGQKKRPIEERRGMKCSPNQSRGGTYGVARPKGEECSLIEQIGRGN